MASTFFTTYKRIHLKWAVQCWTHRRCSRNAWSPFSLARLSLYGYTFIHLLMLYVTYFWRTNHKEQNIDLVDLKKNVDNQDGPHKPSHTYPMVAGVRVTKMQCKYDMGDSWLSVLSVKKGPQATFSSHPSSLSFHTSIPSRCTFPLCSLESRAKKAGRVHRFSYTNTFISLNLSTNLIRLP